MAYSFLDLAHDVLKAASRPMTYREIWEAGKTSGLVEKGGWKGATPWTTLSAYLSVEVRKQNPSFVGVGKNPRRYFLASRSQEIQDQPLLVFADSPTVAERTSYDEKDLHPLLAYFVHSSPNFLGERQVYSKTIMHQKTSSRKNSLAQWLHPDMVGAYFPFDDWGKKAIDLSKSLSTNSAQIFSFELKKSIDTNNYREIFFQAVSNSSWAHEGYLVAAKVAETDELRSELARLTNAFGIGIIHLKVEDIDSSCILFPAKNKSDLDWGTIDRLCENGDFGEFVDCVNASFRAGEVLETKCDLVNRRDDLMQYIHEKLKVKTAQ